MTRQSIAALALVLFVVACGDASNELDVDEYVDEVRAIATGLRDDFEEADKLAEFPIEGELTNAAAGYMAYDDAFERLRSLQAPDAISSQHELVVSRLDDVQDVVGEYLNKASKEGGFTFAALEADPAIRQRFTALADACDELSTALAELGAGPIPQACGLLTP